MKSMNTPWTRAEFERNFHLLHRQIEEGRLSLPPGNSVESLVRLRFLPNGRIDFLSVDEIARLQANMTAQFDEEFIGQMLTDSNVKRHKSEVEDRDKPKC